MAENSKIEWTTIGARLGSSGPTPKPPRDGDKQQARQRINVEVRSGRRDDPNSLPCCDCGHLGDDRRHEYHHHNGYAAEHHYDVIALCTKCHAKRDNTKASQTHCKNGHAFTPENTLVKKNGCRGCRECRRARDRGRRDAEYWRAYRRKRKAVDCG